MNTNKKHWAGLIAGILSLAGYASAANLGSEKYTYDASGNIVEKSINGQVTQMTYDSSNRLTGRQAIGQSKETTAYDAAGRPIAMKDGTAQATRGMSYGYGDKVLENKNHDTNTGFFYNAKGQLVGKKTDSAVATYTWDGNVLAADDAQPFTNEAHISGGIPVLVAGEEIVTTDYLGSTLASGDKNFTSTAYGEGLEGVRFTGKPFIKELGKYAFHHRMYSPETNRWTVKDPSGFPDGKNNYLYVNGDPMSRFDIYGTEQVTISCHWDKTANGQQYQGDGSTIFNYTFEDDSGGNRRLKTHSFAGNASYTGTQTYTEDTVGTTLNIDTDGNGSADAIGSTRVQYGTYASEHTDTSAVWAETKVVLGVTWKRDRASAEFKINEPKATSYGYFTGATFTTVNGPTASTSVIKKDDTTARFFGDWVEQ